MASKKARKPPAKRPNTGLGQSQPVTPGVKTRPAATRPGAWHTATGGKSRSYRGK